MKKFLFTFLLVAFMQSVSASNSVAHVYFANRFMEHFPNYTQEQQKEFIVGTVFPDIRNIDPSVHDQTHLEGVTLQDVINEESPFVAGWKLHCLVDDVRTAFMKEWGIFEKMAVVEVPRLGSFLKIVEDELVFKKVNRRQALSSLVKFYDEEREIEKDEKVLKKWHRMNMDWLCTPPRHWLKKMAYMKQGFLKYTHEELKSWDQHMQEALENEDMQMYFQALLDHFEELFKSA